MIILKTERLILRAFHILDGEAMALVFGDPEVMRFGDGVKDRPWIQQWLSDCLACYHSHWGFGKWAVVKADSRQVIGYCGLEYMPDICGKPEVELAYRLAKNFWGKGYATEACLAVRDYAFQTLSLSRVIALIDPGNVASLRVAEKVGMRYQKEYMGPGYSHPDRVYVVEDAATSE